MKREELIQKWLDHSLNAEELDAFKKLEDYDALTKLDTNLKHFKASDYNTEEALSKVLHTIKTPQKASNNWMQAAIKIAAIFVLCFGAYYYTTTLDTSVQTLVAQKQVIELPDASSVNLNALSTLTFNKSSWDKNREVTLDGEAFFKVAKGSKFDVKTETGTVTVLGTQFNIKQRDNYFEVICYEGLVGVLYKNKQTKLHPGDTFLIIDGKYIATEKENQLNPSWLNNLSRFKSLPYKEVLKEFERQYNVSIKMQGIDDSQLFTGSFTHNNIETALKSITLPLHLSYNKTDHTITLKSE
ncbi:FecR family protein [Ichthyenterobacterium magnum]|uniref:FecR family protein n=1 Tax=Ichthyenterobacterium magnum TaxID=1230530 RepID=A0A420DEX1_9FLAO|nr:FecR family protein [Ichthyenterobacterium magnum]RKE90901.1 FecR family protein [Ichthyenterobacterium magnum]